MKEKNRQALLHKISQPLRRARRRNGTAFEPFSHMKPLYVLLAVLSLGPIGLQAVGLDTLQAHKALNKAAIYRNHGWADSALSATAHAADAFRLAADRLRRPKDEGLRHYLLRRSLEVECQLADSLTARGRFDELARRWLRLEDLAHQTDLPDELRERLCGWLARVYLDRDSLDRAHFYTLEAERLFRLRTAEEGQILQPTPDSLNLESTKWYRQRSFVFQPQTFADSVFLVQRPIVNYARPTWTSHQDQVLSYRIDVQPDGRVDGVYEIKAGRKARRVPVRRAAATCLYKWQFLPDPAAEAPHPLVLTFRFDRP